MARALIKRCKNCIFQKKIENSNNKILYCRVLPPIEVIDGKFVYEKVHRDGLCYKYVERSRHDV